MATQGDRRAPLEAPKAMRGGDLFTTKNTKGTKLAVFIFQATTRRVDLSRRSFRAKAEAQRRQEPMRRTVAVRVT
jgi:hypothetical protein